MPHVCPWWFGYFLIGPLRRWAHDPERIVGPYVVPGMTVVDFGCGMGHFSLPMARMVGPSGRVLCIDIQEKMLAGVTRRAAKAGLGGRIEARLAAEGDLCLRDLAGTVDFALAMFVVHEVPEPRRLLDELAGALGPDGHLLVAEPIFHVREAAFRRTVEDAGSVGLVVVGQPAVRRSRAVLLRRGTAS